MQSALMTEEFPQYNAMSKYVVSTTIAETDPPLAAHHHPALN